MNTPDYVFKLVKSLSASEKRYFKTNLQRGGSKKKKNYELLFDALNHFPGEEYDEALFIRANRGKPFIKNLAAEKNYLYKTILKICKNHAAESNSYLKFYAEVNEVLFLLTHGLTTQAEVMIKSLIEHYPQQDYLKQILLRQLLKNSYAHRDDMITPDVIRLTEEEVFPLIRGYEFRLKVTQLQRQYVHYESRGYLKANASALESLQKSFEALLGSPDADAFSQITLATNIVSLLGFKGQHEESVKRGLHFLEKFQQAPYTHYFGKRVKAVFMINIIENMLESEFIEEAMGMILDLESIIDFEGYSDPASMNVYVSLLKIRYFLFTQKIDDGFAELNHLQNKLQTCVPPAKPYTMLVALAYEAAFLTYTGNYSQLIDLINNNPYLGLREPMLQFVKFNLQLHEFICHLAFRNYSLMESLVLSMKRKLSRHEINGEYHTNLIKLLTTILETNLNINNNLNLLISEINKSAILTKRSELYYKQALLNALNYRG